MLKIKIKKIENKDKGSLYVGKFFINKSLVFFIEKRIIIDNIEYLEFKTYHQYSIKDDFKEYLWTSKGIMKLSSLHMKVRSKRYLPWCSNSWSISAKKS